MPSGLFSHFIRILMICRFKFNLISGKFNYFKRMLMPCRFKCNLFSYIFNYFKIISMQWRYKLNLILFWTQSTRMQRIHRYLDIITLNVLPGWCPLEWTKTIISCIKYLSPYHKYIRQPYREPWLLECCKSKL